MVKPVTLARPLNNTAVVQLLCLEARLGEIQNTGWVCNLSLQFTGANTPFLNTQLLTQDAEGGNLSYYLNYSTPARQREPTAVLL